MLARSLHLHAVVACFCLAADLAYASSSADTGGHALLPPLSAVQPTLDWQPRSDWLDVRKGCNGTAPATGDGKSDDTKAIQGCLEQFTKGSGGHTLYLPPGLYRITQTLTMGCKNDTDPNANPRKLVGCLVGGSIIGHGAATTIIWAGAANGTMLLDSGATGFRYVGVHWDGAGVAWYGVAHQSIKMFETECHHEAEAYSNFAWAGIAIDRYRLASPNHIDGATAETYFRNCLFENNAVGVLWSNFNALDNHFDGCLWRNNMLGLHGIEGTVYVTNSRFENSSAADIQRNAAEWNHDTLRNIVSVGSNMFVRSDCALSLYDCHVDGWVGDHNAGKFFKERMEGTFTPCVCGGSRCRGDCDGPYWQNGAAMAVLGQMQIHDSTFTNAQCNKSVVPDDPPPGSSTVNVAHNGNSTGVICCVLDGVDYNTHTMDDPFLLASSTLGPPAAGFPKPEWTCKHQDPKNGHDTEIWEHGSLRGTIYQAKPITGEPPLGPNVTLLNLPDGQCPPTGITSASNFLKSTWDIPTKVFEVSQFGPFPSNNKSHPDATSAIQATVDAAATAGSGAVAYFPPGKYYISKTIQVKGSNFWVSGGSRLSTIFQWRGDAEPLTAIMAVAPGSQVHLEEFQLNTLNSTDNTTKLLITGTTPASEIDKSAAACTNVTINRVYLGGYSSSKHISTSGLRIQGLSKRDIVDITSVDGDIHAMNNDGLILTGFHAAGQLVLEGQSSGFFGQRVRFTCCTHDFTTTIIGAQTYAVAAFYQESAPDIFRLKGATNTINGTESSRGDTKGGSVAINAIKLSANNWVNSVFENWTGEFFQTGGWATTQDSGKGGNMTVRQTGGNVNLTYTLAFPWQYPFTFELGPGAELTEIGTMQHDSSGEKHRIKDQLWSGSAESIVSGYDLLRRFGRLDLQLHYPELGVVDTCA